MYMYLQDRLSDVQHQQVRFVCFFLCATTFSIVQKHGHLSFRLLHSGTEHTCPQCTCSQCTRSQRAHSQLSEQRHWEPAQISQQQSGSFQVIWAIGTWIIYQLHVLTSARHLRPHLLQSATLIDWENGCNTTRLLSYQSGDITPHHITQHSSACQTSPCKRASFRQICLWLWLVECYLSCLQQASCSNKSDTPYLPDFSYKPGHSLLPVSYAANWPVKAQLSYFIKQRQ